jgi:hypothetical protein
MDEDVWALIVHQIRGLVYCNGRPYLLVSIVTSDKEKNIYTAYTLGNYRVQHANTKLLATR